MLKLKKLPPLQPHLTGTNSDTAQERSFKLTAVEELRRSRKIDLGGHGIPGLNVRNWAQQAQTVTDATQPAGRSAATAAEIRLREALHKCSLAAGEYSEHTNRPYRLRTAVCCKLLEEFAALAGPFSGILHTLFEELVDSIYSNSCAHQGGSSRMDQLPYYVVVSKLQAQNSALVSEQREFRKQLGQQGSMLDDMSTKLQRLASALESANTSNQDLTLSQTALERREKVAQNELQSAKQMLVDTKSRLQQVTAEAAIDKETLENKLAKLEEDTDTGKQALQLATQVVRSKEEEITQLHAMLQGMIRQSEVQKLEDEAQELARTVSDQAVDLKKQKRELEELRCHTPRPSWPKLHEDMHAAGALSPAEPTGAHPQQASCQLAEKLSTRLMEHARNLQLQESNTNTSHMRCLLASEPAAAAAATAGCLHVPPCLEGTAILSSHGTDPIVPKMLRTAHKVAVRTSSKHDTLQSVLHILAHAPPSSTSLHDAIYNLWLVADVPLTAMPHVGYSLMASLQCHGSSDALVGLIHDIWLGKAPMHALVRMGELLRGLSKLLETLSKLKLEDSPCAGLLPKADFVQMLQKLCPGKSEQSIESLAASLSWHEEGSFVRVGEIDCYGIDCAQLVDTAALCSSTSLNSASSEQVQVVEVDGAEDPGATMQEEFPRQASTSLDSPDQIGTEESLEPLEEVDDSQESATEDAINGEDPSPVTTTSEQVSHEPVSDVPPDAEVIEDTGDSDGSNHTLPVLLLQQHAEELVHLRRATWEAVCACDQDRWPEGDSLTEIQSTLESIQGIDRRAIPGCVDVWSRLPCPSTRERVATGLLASAPLQRKQDFDLVAAAAWVDGLQGQEDGWGSAAMLPEVV